MAPNYHCILIPHLNVFILTAAQWSKAVLRLLLHRQFLCYRRLRENMSSVLLRFPP